MKDLVVLLADKNMEFLVRGLFPRIPDVEQIQPFNFEPLVHPYRDPGIYNDAHDFLRPFIKRYSYAIVILDHTGCGKEEKTREEVEKDIEDQLIRSGWRNNACAIAINPELENWIWVNEARMEGAISWKNTVSLYDWLHKKRLEEARRAKTVSSKRSF